MNWFYQPWTAGMTEVFPVFPIEPDYDAAQQTERLGYAKGGSVGQHEAEAMTGHAMVLCTAQSGKSWTRGWFIRQ